MPRHAEQPIDHVRRTAPVHSTVAVDRLTVTNMPAHGLETSWLSTVVVLFKLRIVALLLLAGLGGASLALGALPSLSMLGMLIFCGGFAAAGASALNQYLEHDQDALMVRTKHRPLVASKFEDPGWVPLIGVGMIVLPVLLTAPVNMPLAIWSALGAVTYVGIYTIWLKPRTPLNIVIGGFAGSCGGLQWWGRSGCLVKSRGHCTRIATLSVDTHPFLEPCHCLSG